MRSPFVGVVGVLALVLSLQGCGGGGSDTPDSAPGTKPPASQNRAPTITGAPPTKVVVGEPYRFAPQASDPDGGTLTFSITNKPNWATFDASTGQLAGTPSSRDAGSTSSGIVITVADREASASLAAFSIAVVAAVAAPPGSTTGAATLSWTPPLSRTDGSALTNLSGYRIYYGNAPGQFGSPITINNPGITTYVVENLQAGTYYFVVTAVDSAGGESAASNSASKTVG